MKPAAAPKSAADAQLEQLAGAVDADAAALEQPAAAAQAGEPAAPAVNFNEEAKQLVTFAADLATGFWPSLAEVYTLERRTAITAALVPVLAKYDFTLARVFERWGPEINLAFVALPLVTPTLAAIRADQAKKAEADKPAGEATRAPGDPVPPNAAPAREFPG